MHPINGVSRIVTSANLRIITAAYSDLGVVVPTSPKQSLAACSIWGAAGAATSCWIASTAANRSARIWFDIDACLGDFSFACGTNLEEGAIRLFDVFVAIGSDNSVLIEVTTAIVEIDETSAQRD